MGYNMKKKLMLLTICVCLSGCGANITDKDKTVEKKTYTNYTESIDKENIDEVTIVADHVIDISDVSKLRDFDENVFIGTVESIDGCSTIIANNTFNPMPSEYGKISVLKNLKGNTNANSIKYTRYGGVISIAEYEKYAPQEMVANNEKHRNDAGQQNIDKEATYMNFQYENDIEFEAGKTYLFFTMYESSTDTYVINGVQYGTREIYQPTTTKRVFTDLPIESSLQIKNNATNEYESLDSFISTYF